MVPTLVLGWLLSLPGAEPAAAGADSHIIPNRTLPTVAPPPQGLAFSASPTVEEIFRARVFEEPLVPVGGEPSRAENAALAAALAGYSKRNGADDFSSLTGFLETHPQSPWAAALLMNLGLEYYNTAHYSLALDAWGKAWALAKDATDAKGKAVGDRAAGELAYMDARLGRMTELEALLKSVEGRVFVGSATERTTGAREALWNMQNRPETSFRCGPLALHRIKLLVDPHHPGTEIIHTSASTQKGCSLAQVAQLSQQVGLNYQMTFRKTGGEFVVPSMVHWKVGHYAAMIRREGDRYLLEDPTFGNTVWATRQALEEETSGYFLIPPGLLPERWRLVEAKEGENVWGKGPVPSGNSQLTACNDFKAKSGRSCNPPPCVGMAVPDVHLAVVSLNLNDQPVGYAPPVGPDVRFTVRYSQRDAFQPTIFTYSNFGPKWTCDWIAYITDNPLNTLADVNYYARGGGTRTFAGFDTNAQTYAFQQYDQTQLKRTGSASYEMLWPDGSKYVFTQSDGSVGTSRKLFLTQVLDPYGNTVGLGYDANLRLMAITDAIGQVTTLSYGLTNDIYKVTQVTDPFGRFATFDYDNLGRLTNITDVIGLSSQFAYQSTGDFIDALTTPYGTTTFTSSDSPRRLDTLYPDGTSDRVEFEGNATPGLAATDPATSVPHGMATYNAYLTARNTIYWSRNAFATAAGDYTKAAIYHWLHTSDLSFASGILESSKEALEGRVWYDYAGQNAPYVVGGSNRPQHIGRVLDDGTTQLYTYAYNGFGHVTNVVDPVGRTFSYIYATNGIDLLEVRMTRAGKNELLFSATYNAQHVPLTTTDAAGQTTTYTYNSRGQLLARSNPKNEITSYSYDTNGYLIGVDGPLPGTNDVVTATYDSNGRMRTKTDVSGYTLTFDYDDLDRMTKITHPDSTFEQITFDRLDPAILRDRAGRQTLLQYDSMRQLVKRTDALARATIFQWCTCGGIKSLTDPLGRTTLWHKDVQNRLISKEYGDGSQVTYTYENTTSRLRSMTDEKLQVASFAYNLDDTIRSVGYGNTAVPTPAVTYTYDPDYQRILSMTDGTGATAYQYVPASASPTLGAGQLASIDGPLPNDTITYGYDELGRRISTAINGVAMRQAFDAAGRVISETNALGTFTYSYDGPSSRLISEIYPNGQTVTRTFANNAHDRVLQSITNQFGGTLVSQFSYARDIPRSRIDNWVQQFGTSAPDIYGFTYDAVDQLLSTTVTNNGLLVNNFAYSYDPVGNRLSEQVGSATTTANYNALNELSTSSGGSSNNRTNEWDGKNRLTAVNSGPQRAEFTYDGLSRLASIRLLTNGVPASLRRFVWCDNEICEERDALGAVVKRFFNRGVRIEEGNNAGNYFYGRDHLDSIRELTDSSGNVRARYSYDPFGRPTQTAGDLAADFRFAGMFFAGEAGLSLARFRTYDAVLGRWLSRDPLRMAERREGPNLYAYVGNNPVNKNDRLGLGAECCKKDRENLQNLRQECLKGLIKAGLNCVLASQEAPEVAAEECQVDMEEMLQLCEADIGEIKSSAEAYLYCLERNKCPPKRCGAPGPAPSPPPGPPPCQFSSQLNGWVCSKDPHEWTAGFFVPAPP